MLRERGRDRSVLRDLLLVTTLGLLVCSASLARQEPPGSESGSASDEHADLFLENRFPSATTCASCHPSHYREWSVSPHSYAQMSPIFNAFHGTVLKLTNGTNGDFCIRCHTPVGMNQGEAVFMSNMDRHPTSREGVTCIVCHRISNAYGKLSGRLAIVEGDIFEPVYGRRGKSVDPNLCDGEDAGEDPGEFWKMTQKNAFNPCRGRAGRRIHRGTEPFFQLTTPGFCATCHDVNLVNGFRLEEAFSEYKTSPAARRGVTCQDCHMGPEPGVPSEFHDSTEDPVAFVRLEPRPIPVVVERDDPDEVVRRTNHMFIGPDYSIVHPGIFPHNTEAQELATIRQWLTFDHEAGWGTDDFEDSLADGYEFPEHWRSIDDRYDARDVVEDNLALLAEADIERLKILRAGYGLSEIEILKNGRKGIEFKLEVQNLTDGHGVPTGFDAERLVFLHTTVTDSEGTVIFESGDLDPNGDVRDLHSLYVHNGELPLDKQLFSLQSRFVTRMLRGGEREQVLAVNYSPSPLVFLRPSMTSTILTGRPLGVRKHKQNIDPLGHRVARYRVKADRLTGKTPYRVKVELIAGMIPVNLLTEIEVVGFDYFMSTREVAERVVAGHRVIRVREALIESP